MHLKPKAPVSMLTKLMRQERDTQGEEIRGGTRGGKDQFKWNDIRSLSYKERECYLGGTSKIGFLDKGGKWRKGDWYKNIERKKKIDKGATQDRIKEIKKQEQRDMEIALGLRKPEIQQKKITQKDLEKLRNQKSNDIPEASGLGYNDKSIKNHNVNQCYKLKGNNQFSITSEFL